MRRTCARPGCHDAATTTLSYDYANRTVWLESLTPEAHPMVHDLCEAHGDALSVPRGWLLRDQRPSVTPLFVGADRTFVTTAEHSYAAAPGDVAGDLPFRRAASA